MHLSNFAFLSFLDELLLKTGPQARRSSTFVSFSFQSKWRGKRFTIVEIMFLKDEMIPKHFSRSWNVCVINCRIRIYLIVSGLVRNTKSFVINAFDIAIFPQLKGFHISRGLGVNRGRRMIKSIIF